MQIRSNDDQRDNQQCQATTTIAQCAQVFQLNTFINNFLLIKADAQIIVKKIHQTSIDQLKSLIYIYK